MEDIFAPKSGSFGMGSPKEEKMPDLFAEPESSGVIRRAVADPLVGLAKGVLVGIPETAIGLADIPTMGLAGKGLEKIGIDFKGANKAFTDLLSPETQAAQQEVAKAEGFLPTIGAALQNPSALVQAVMESAPSMVTGAGIGRAAASAIGKGVGAAGLTQAQRMGRAVGAGAFGEGAVSAGQTAEQIRQLTESGTLTPDQSGIILGSGALTSLFGFMGGKLAQRLGIADVDTLLAGGVPMETKKGILRKIAETAIVEGAFEELPQSAQEQMAQNIALGKPPTEGVANAAAMGMLAGAVMGAAGGGGGHFLTKMKTPAEKILESDPLNKQIDDMIKAADPDGVVQPPAIEPIDLTGTGIVQGAGQGFEGTGPGYGMGGKPLPPAIDLTGMGEVSGAGTGVGGMGGVYEPPPAPSKFTTMFNSVLNGEPAGTGDPRLDQVISGEHAKGKIEAPDDIQGIIDDYGLGEYDEEYPPAAPPVAEPPPTGGITPPPPATPPTPTSPEPPIVEPEPTVEAEPETPVVTEPETPVAPPEPPPSSEPTKLSPVPPPVNGKRNWYEFTDPDFPASQLTEEEQERMEEGGPTPEETAVYDQWKKDKQAVVAGIGKQEQEQAAQSEDIIDRVKRKWAENNPDIPVKDVANHIASMGGSTGRQLKATEFTSELSTRLGIPDDYSFIGKILDRLGIPIILTDAKTADPSGKFPTDGTFSRRLDGMDKGRIYISHRAMGNSRDYGPGYGVAHALEVYVHEALHGIVRNSPNWLSSQKRLFEFRETLLHHQASAPDAVKRYLQHSDKNDIDELIAEALSDAKIAQWLDSIPTEGVRNPSKTMWGKLKDIIFRALETFGVGKSKLDELNEILDEVLAVQMVDEAPEVRPPVTPEVKPEVKPPATPEAKPPAKTTLTADEVEKAIHPEYGSINKSNTVALAKMFKKKIRSSGEKFDKKIIKEIVAEEYGTTAEELNKLERRGIYNHKAIEEAFEYAIVLYARDIINFKQGGPVYIQKALEDLYYRMANLSSRTSESTIMQQYSTPVPIAWSMNRFLGMDGDLSNVSVYEPTAGNGMLLIGANPRSSAIYANELDKGPRINNLRDFINNGKVTNGDALALVNHPGAKSVDRVIMNPPFGAAKTVRAFDGYQMSKLEHQIVASGLTAMKDNGKAAFIIGGHNIKSSGQMTMTDKIFFNWLYNNYNVTHNIDVNGDLYARQGTKFPIRIITVEGRKPEPGTGLPEYTGIEPAENFQEISNILERGKPDEELQGEGQVSQGEVGGQEGIPDKGLPEGVPPTGGVGGRPPRGPAVSGGELGVGETGGLGGRTEGTSPSGPQPGGEGGLAGGPAGGTGVRGGQPGPEGGVVPTGETGGEAGRDSVGPKSSLDDAFDELDSMFMPYEEAVGLDEEKYQKAKPVFEKIATEIVNEDTNITTQDFSKRMKERFIAKWDAIKSYVRKFVREEFEALKQIIKDSSFFQTNYKPRSEGPNGNTRVPKNQEQSIQKALDEIEAEHGNIDEWVAKELGYNMDGLWKPLLYKAYAAEQIDALAMSIQNITNNAGMIVGDQTGVGKGRVVAGIIRWANKRGKIPVFVTDKPNLFSDMYRDLLAIDHPIRPFIMNSAKANIVDQDTGVVIMNQGKDGKGAEAFAGGKMNWDAITANPEAYFKRNNMQAIFTTYSQHNDKSYKNQDQILEAMGPNNIFILDESHNAAGPSTGADSNTKLKFAHFLDMADGVLYSSATFAKTPENMGIYFRTGLGDSGMRMFELAQAIKAGGNPLQEYISNALARMGQYLRRELDFTGVDFTSSDTLANLSKDDPNYTEKQAALKEQYERDKEVSDKSNVIVRQNVDFSNAIKREKSGLERLLRDKYGVMVGGSGNQRTSVDTTAFSSVVHNFNSQLLMGIKVQRTIDEAKKALDEGRKVVINLTNTMGSFIDDMVDKGAAHVGEPIDFTFKSVLKRSIDNCMRVTVKDPMGVKSRLTFTPEDMQSYMPASYSAYLRVMNSFNRYDAKDLHSSPIDYLIYEIEKISGKPVMELTNRSYAIDYGDKSGQPTLTKRDSDAKDRQRAIRMFNTGLSDVIIINRAGSVGISLHASETFKNVDKTPQKPRRMLLLQPDPDINVFMQALGRIFRKGQTSNPDYRYITSDLPTEIRPNVVLTRKMKSLKANTTSKQGGAEARIDIPDMMNHYGDKVVRDYLERNNEMVRAMGMHDVPDNLTYVKASGKASILPVELQKDFFAEIETDYTSLIQELTEKGENDLITKNYDYKARSIIKNILHTGPDATNPFTGSTYVERMVVRQLKQPHKTAKLNEMIAKNLTSQGAGGTQQLTGEEKSSALMDKITIAAQDFWATWNASLPERYPGDTAAQDRAKGDKNLQMGRERSIYESLLNPRNPANQLRIGDTYDIPLGAGSQENLVGVLTNIIWTPGQGNPLQLSKLKFVFSVSDPIQTMVYNASQSWFRDEVGLNRRGIPENWDSRITEDRQEEKVILTGNMVRAFNILLGLSPKIHFEMVNFTREDKSTEFGLVIARQDEDRVTGLTEGALGREVEAAAAYEYLADPRVETERIISSKNGEVNIQSIITIRKPEDGGTIREYIVKTMASREKGAKYYQDEQLRSFVRNKNFRRHGNRMVANIDADQLRGFMDELRKKFGMNFILPQDQVSHMPYESAEESSFMPFEKAPQFVQDLTNKFLNNPQDDEGKKVIRPFLKSQHDFRWGDKYLGLPWWNAKRYPAWRRAFEIFGIDRPEHRGDYMHNFAKASEPFLALETNMREAGKSSKDIQDANDRISRVIITGDAELGPYLKSLRVQVKDMEEGPLKDRLLARIKQIETENRYSDEQLLEGIKDDQGNKVKLSQQEIEVYKSVRNSLDLMFDTYVDHLQAQAFRQYQKQKWYSILCQAAGIDLNKETTHKIIGAGLNQAALLRAVKIQPDIQKIFERVESKIKETPDNEKMEAGVLYGKIADALTEQISSLEDALSTLTGEKDPKKLTEMTKAIFSAYLYTRPQLKKIKTLRNTYKKQVAFFPRVRDKGEHKIRLMQQIRNKEGQVIKERQIYMKMYDTLSEGVKVYKEIMDRYGKDGVLPEDMYLHQEEATKTPEFAFQGVNDINMQRVLDDAIDGLKLRDVYYNDKGEKVDIHERLRNMGYMALAKQFQSRGFGQHMTHRQWNVIKGYKENNLQLVLFNYMTGMAGIMTKQAAAADFLEHMKDVKDPKLFESLTKYGRDQLRNETDWDRTSNKIRSMMFTWYLGGILRPAIIQLTQNFVTGIPQHAKYLRENKMGGAGKADKDYVTAMKDVATKNYTPIERRMEEQLLIEGVTVDQYIREIFGGLGTRLNQSKLRVLHYLAYPFSQMEIFNRKSAALTRFRPAYKAALAEGLSEEEAYDKAFESARDFVYDTHYAMGKANLPQIAQGEGVGTGVKTLYTFRSFTHNFALSLYNDRKDWKTVMHTLAYVALFGGLMGLPFFKDLFEFVEKHFGYSFTKSIKQALNSAGGKTLETFGMNGLPAMLGANISGSLAMGVPFMGETPADTIYGVYGGMATKIKRAGEAAARGDKYRVFANLAPEVLRSPIVAAEESKIGKELFGTPGYSTTTRGRPVYDETGKPLSLGTGEAMLKAVGFSPTENAAQKSKDQTIRRQESWAAEAKADAAETYLVARVNGDKDALKNLMRDVKEINTGIRSRGIQNLVPLTSVAKVIQASKQSKTKQQLREQRYKRVEL